MIFMNNDLIRPYFISAHTDCVLLWENKDEYICNLEQLKDGVGALSEPERTERLWEVGRSRKNPLKKKT